jgi:hypothetical protein
MKQLINILVIIIGILLVLPLLGVDALGSLTDGIAAWVIAIIILVIGIIGLTKKTA